MMKMEKVCRMSRLGGVAGIALGFVMANLAWAQGAGGRAPNEFYPKVPKNIGYPYLTVEMGS